MELTAYTDRLRMVVAIKDIDLGVGYRHANGYFLPKLRIRLCYGKITHRGNDRRLGGAIRIP
jgi:hypothetical protein